jgi:S-(hydroxymethyl)glutathione dehydrogenase/alcohol dehydrogenase
MANTFKAAVLVSLNRPLEIMELLFPPLTEGQVLVKNIASGICRSQLMEATGMRGEDKWLPHLLGHEAVGVVEEVGPKVTKVNPGDKVVVGWIPGIGINSKTPTFSTASGVQINSGSATTFSEYSVISENRTFKAPSGFSDDFLPQFGCALLTGGGMVISTLNSLDSTLSFQVLVLGFGGVGTAAALALKSYPNINISIVEQSGSRRELATAFGFKNVFETVDEALNQNSQTPNRFDLCFESAGTTTSIEEGFRSIKDKGILTFASHPANGHLIKLDPHDLIKGKRIQGTWGGNLNPDSAIDDVASRLLIGKTNADLLVGPRFDLEDINTGLSYLDSANPGKPIIYFGDVK